MRNADARTAKRRLANAIPQHAESAESQAQVRNVPERRIANANARIAKRATQKRETQMRETPNRNASARKSKTWTCPSSWRVAPSLTILAALDAASVVIGTAAALLFDAMAPRAMGLGARTGLLGLGACSRKQGKQGDGGGTAGPRLRRGSKQGHGSRGMGKGTCAKPCWQRHKQRHGAEPGALAETPPEPGGPADVPAKAQQ